MKRRKYSTSPIEADVFVDFFTHGSYVLLESDDRKKKIDMYRRMSSLKDNYIHVVATTTALRRLQSQFGPSLDLVLNGHSCSTQTWHRSNSPFLDLDDTGTGMMLKTRACIAICSALPIEK